MKKDIEIEEYTLSVSSLSYNDLDRFTTERIAHWNLIAGNKESIKSWGKYYHNRLAEIYKYLVSPGQKILEIGCGEGDLLSALNPKFGIGLDFSNTMINKAASKHKSLRFFEMDAHQLNLNEKFDIIILSDLVNDLKDIQIVFERIQTVCLPHTRILINFYSHLWEIPLKFAQRIGISTPTLIQSWVTREDILNILELSDFQVIRDWEEILVPFKIPLVSYLANHYFIRFWPFKYFALTNFVVARPKSLDKKEEMSVTVVVPARNEEGNIKEIMSRIPTMGSSTEIIFVEGHSSDKTYETIEKAIHEVNKRPIYELLKQPGKGKADAVRKGFETAKGEILMILDCDMTVPPEDLLRFYRALQSGKGEFINGVRLIYPMDKEAMKFFNLLGNKLFSIIFSWIIGQPIKDTLCGTKVLWKKNYEQISANRSYFGDFDPFGDFDLLFGAAKLGLKIIDLPIRYRERTYGTTNIQRWKHGWLLIRMAIFAAKRIKFI